MILSSLTRGCLFEAWQGLPFLEGGFAVAGALGLLRCFFQRTKRTV